MMRLVVLQFLLTLTLYSAGARPLDGDPALPATDLYVLFQLPETTGNGSRVLLLLQQQQQKQEESQADYDELRYSADPNVVLMLEHFEPGEWVEAAPRLARAHPYPAPRPRHSGNGYIDLVYVPRRRRTGIEPFAGQVLQPSQVLKPAQVVQPAPAVQPAQVVQPAPMLQPPPQQAPPVTAAGAVPVHKVGRSISTAEVTPNQPEVTANDENPDFLSSLVTIPQVWMHDLGHMIIQPLRKDKNPVGERDSFEYFGMVGKAPYITCPLGFKKNTLGTCRPVFRSKRDAERRRESAPPKEAQDQAY